MATPDISLKLAKRLSEIVNDSFASGEMLEKVTPITAELLKFWFTEPYIDERRVNFHEGQRQSLLNVIYLHEVARVEKVIDIYSQIAPDLIAEVDMVVLSKEKYSIPKYAVKMATGTGKTWVMHALLLWQMLNARHEDEKSGRYTTRFLIVAPGLVVYDRLLDAFMGRLKQGTAERDFFTNDFYRNQDLFIPPAYRHEVFSFLQANVVSKEEGIGRKVTGEGLIALTNWHLFMQGDNEEDVVDEDSPIAIIDDILPVRPGLTGGNQLDTLDRQYLRGNELDYLASLPDLMVVNDEAHHIHENKVDGEIQEVEWQKGLSYIGRGKSLFVQIDFSATPYDTTGTGKKKVYHYFPHIVVDFDLSTAMKKGLVKTLLLDKRKELTDLEDLDYNAVRDCRKVISLSDGQRLMLRAGLKKLRTLEEGFVKIDETKYPKMLIMCEDTNVSPFVEQFLREEGLAEEDILRIDSSKQGELKEDEWKRVKERLFNVDQYATPKVIISVLMLREGFDVNNICVIVPLRSSESSILLEQTIGRGLRQMWRDPQYEEEKRENRNRILVRREPPLSYIDMLSIIEHPKFIDFYKDLLSEGLAGTDERDISTSSVTGDIIRVGLKDDYEKYDMFWPFVIREAEEEIQTTSIDIDTLAPFEAFTLERLREFLATEGEVFVSQAVMTETQFGKYEVKADLFTAVSYNQYLQKLLNIVLSRRYRHKNLPVMQINQIEIISAIDVYIRTRLFSQSFNPFVENDWKILLAKDGIVTQHIIKEISIAVHKMQENLMSTEAEVEKIWFSTVEHLRIRESFSLKLQKVIYERIGYPSNRGGFEKDMAEFLDRDADVERFLKISESQHVFATIFYLREDGLLASYHPDFMVCTKDKIFILETKSNRDIKDVNVRRKRIASIEWCKKINQLKAEDRMNREWEYLLLSEDNFYSYYQNGATFEDIARLSKVSLSSLTGDLFA
ncbi:MAG: DEAD/DEAH box helicase family protein [Paludibacteraceae bacterium]|nr:DEAD/DEAH box helicase family protein [Paludibacteraceae bacterium]